MKKNRKRGSYVNKKRIWTMQWLTLGKHKVDHIKGTKRRREEGIFWSSFLLLPSKGREGKKRASLMVFSLPPLPWLAPRKGKIILFDLKYMQACIEFKIKSCSCSCSCEVMRRRRTRRKREKRSTGKKEGRKKGKKKSKVAHVKPLMKVVCV